MPTSRSGRQSNTSASHRIPGATCLSVCLLALAVLFLLTHEKPAGAMGTSPKSLLPRHDPALAGFPLAATAAITTYTYLPVVQTTGMRGWTGETYTTLTVNGAPTDRPAEIHADLNLSMRGWGLTTAPKTLVDIGGATDSNAPHLWGLFADNRTPVFRNVYRVNDWNWSCNCCGDPIASYPVTLLGMQTQAGETIHVPSSGYTIGSVEFVPARGFALGAGYEVLVLYASSDRLTLKYTREDNVVSGYTLHIEDLFVDPNLLALYDEWNAKGRGQLPAINAGQAVGRAAGAELRVSIRDTGLFMDPRSRKDWWPGRK